MWTSQYLPWSNEKSLPWTSPMDIQASINADKYVHIQATAATSWMITHNLGGYPSVTVQDVAANVVITDVKYWDPNTLEVTVYSAAAGKAVLN